MERNGKGGAVVSIAFHGIDVGFCVLVFTSGWSSEEPFWRREKYLVILASIEDIRRSLHQYGDAQCAGNKVHFQIRSSVPFSLSVQSVFVVVCECSWPWWGLAYPIIVVMK